jgi:hypothetical protein
MRVKVQSADKIWQSADGSRVIHEVVLLTTEGNKVKAKTFSRDIAAPGWEGEVDTYKKSGNKGPETFIRQPKTDFVSPTETSSEPAWVGPTSGSKAAAPVDSNKDRQLMMCMSYAKDLLVALVETAGYTKEEFNKLLQETIRGGGILVDGAAPDVTPDDNLTGDELNAEAKKSIERVFGLDENGEVLDDEQIPML